MTALLCGTALVGCDRADPEAAFGSASATPNVVLLVADTLRADRMSLYGAARRTTPVLERLAATATVFERSWSQAACTLPSVNSLLTSQPAASFLGEPARDRRSLEGRGALATRLREAGFATAAVSASWVVRATESLHNDWGGGYDAGFDVFDETCAGKAAACVSARGVEWIDERPEPTKPFFLYLHYLDPHDPYRPPRDHVRRFATREVDTADVRRGDPNRFARDPSLATPDDVAHLVDLYDEEIRYLDGQIGRLFEALGHRGLLPRTIVVLASDHGESFAEHGTWKHCGSVYEEQTRTPLAFWVPGLTRGERAGRPAENLDIVPTVLDLLDLPDAADPSLAGESLRAALGGGATANEPDLAFTSQGGWQAVSDGRLKRIEHVGRGESWLFDLRRDPTESRAIDAPQEDDALDAAMRERFEGSGDRARAWDDVAKHLRALGYLE